MELFIETGQTRRNLLPFILLVEPVSISAQKVV